MCYEGERRSEGRGERLKRRFRFGWVGVVFLLVKLVILKLKNGFDWLSLGWSKWVI